MREVLNGLYDRLASIPEIVADLSTYMSNPAIFTRDPVPVDAVTRYIVVEDAFDDGPFDTKTTLGREVLHDIFVYDTETGDASLAERVARNVRDVLHRQNLTVSGYGTLVAVANGPRVAPTDDHIYGRVVTARFQLIKAQEV
jgi:hypothetical protein